MARSSQFPPSVDPGVPREWPAPAGWTRARFRDLVEVVERPVDLLDGAEYQLVNAKRSRGGIVARERARGKDIRVKNQHALEADDFVMSSRQIIHGACGVVPENLAGAIVSNEYVILRPRRELLTAYLRELSFTSYFQRTCFHSSVGVDVEKMVFKVERWLDYSISIPPRAEQQRVLEVLGSVDDAVEADEAVVVLIDQLRSRLAGELLQPVRTAGWRTTTIGEVARVAGGSGFPPKLQGRTDLEIPFLKVSDMNAPGNERVASKAANYVSRETLEQIRAKVCPPGTTIFPKVGAALLTNKRRMLGVEAAFDNNVMGLVPTGVDAEFLYYFMKTVDFRGMAQPGALPSVNGGTVASIPIRIPPRPEQEAIVGALRAVDEAAEAQFGSLAARRELKRALSEALLTGRERVV